MTTPHQERITNKKIEIANISKEIVDLQRLEEKLKKRAADTRSEQSDKVLLRFKLINECEKLENECVC